ncbi:MAG TPA: DEAD/DEAH box helicase [Gammaproteobacteria bacterium]|nr:DEAD/DEAH box helicase [Gammaproteobacteria bacterium]
MGSNSRFASIGLSADILKAVAEQSYTRPTAIQQQAIPHILKGKDLLAAAQTGTGKSAAFALPLLHMLSQGKAAQSNQVRALILTPTRELAVQVGQSVATYAKYLSIRSAVVYGGVKINPQMMQMRKGVDVLVATPGRLLDLYRQNAIKFDQLETFVLDEADRMLDMGFIVDIQKIMDVLPDSRQNLLFSATFSEDIRKLAKKLLNKPVEVSTAASNTLVKTVNHWIVPVDKKQKTALLIHLIKQNNWQQVIVFVRTRQAAGKLARHLNGEGIKTAEIHGNKTQSARLGALAQFKRGEATLLVATDLAARGLDIEQLPAVINFDLPDVAQDYIHRIGRTGRAGLRGQAVSLVCADEFDKLTDIEHLLKKLLIRKFIDGFEPRHDVPESSLWRKKKKPKKPKKPKTNSVTVSNENKSGRISTSIKSTVRKKTTRQRSRF